MLHLAPNSATGPDVLAARARSNLRRDIKRAVVAATMALAVGITALGTLGVLGIAMAGVGLTMFQIQSEVVWTLVTLVGGVSVGLALWLSYAVWCYEWRENEIS